MTNEKTATEDAPDIEDTITDAERSWFESPSTANGWPTDPPDGLTEEKLDFLVREAAARAPLAPVVHRLSPAPRTAAAVKAIWREATPPAPAPVEPVASNVIPFRRRTP